MYKSITIEFNTSIDTYILLPKHLTKYNDVKRTNLKYSSLVLIFLLVDRYIKYISIGKDNSITFSKIILKGFIISPII